MTGNNHDGMISGNDALQMRDDLNMVVCRNCLAHHRGDRDDVRRGQPEAQGGSSWKRQS